MEGDEEETGTPLIQQRRFLILISLALFAYYSLGVYVRNEGEYIGFAVKLVHPDRAGVGLWVTWGWAFLRYFQRAYERFPELRADIFKAVYSEDRRLALRAALKEARRQVRTGDVGDGKPNVHIVSVWLQMERPRFSIGRGTEETKEVEVKEEPDFTPTQDGGRKYGGMGGTYSWASDTEGGYSTFNFQMVWSGRHVRRHRAVAWLHSVVKLPAISEHVAPIAIAVCAAASPFLFHHDAIPPSDSPKANPGAPVHVEGNGASSGSSGWGRK